MSRRCSAAAPDGFALVDVIVAVVILSIGVLGLAATTSVVAANMRASYVNTRLAVSAQARMEGLLAGGPEHLLPGDRQHGPLRVRWSVTGGDPREIELVVEYRTGSFARADTLVALLHVLPDP